MRKQYYFRPSQNGYYAWDVDRLVELSKNFPIKSIKISSIKELDEDFGNLGNKSKFTARDMALHHKLIQETDLRFPIILSAEGRVMDGMHRIIKALADNQKVIRAIQFTEDPKPDFVDVQENDLPYD